MDSALASVAEQYDVVVIDSPPRLGLLTMSAMCAATAVLATVHPQMLDVTSMRQFLIMTSDLLGSSLRPAAIWGTTGCAISSLARARRRSAEPDGVLHALNVRGACAQFSNAQEHGDRRRRHYQADALRGKQGPVHALDVRGEHDACRRGLDAASPSANFLRGASDWDRASHRHANRRNASHRHDMIEGLNRMTLARRQRQASTDMTSARVVH